MRESATLHYVVKSNLGGVHLVCDTSYCLEGNRSGLGPAGPRILSEVCATQTVKAGGSRNPAVGDADTRGLR
jgi:hypothetical protein